MRHRPDAGPIFILKNVQNLFAECNIWIYNSKSASFPVSAEMQVAFLACLAAVLVFTPAVRAQGKTHDVTTQKDMT